MKAYKIKKSSGGLKETVHANPEIRKGGPLSSFGERQSQIRCDGLRFDRRDARPPRCCELPGILKFKKMTILTEIFLMKIHRENEKRVDALTVNFL